MGRVRTAARGMLGLLAAAVLFVGFVAFAGPSSAQEYGGICSVAAVYDPVAGSLRVLGEGLDPGTETPVTVDGDSIGTATADGSGNVDATFAIELAEGNHTVGILCDDSGVVAASTEVLVLGEIGVPVHVVDPTRIDCRGRLAGYAEGVLPGLSVTFTIDQGSILVASVVADASGRAEYGRQVNLSPGNYTITSRGRNVLGDPFELTVGFTVRDNCPTTPTTLRGTGTGTGTGSGTGGTGIPRTGTDAGPVALVGLGAVAGGAAVVAVARRRRLAAG